MYIPRYFAFEILDQTLTSILGSRETKSIMSLIPKPSDKDKKVNYLREMIGIVNSDNRYKLCIVNRRTDKWAMFITTPFGTIRTQELSYAYGLPYEQKFDAVVFSDIQEIADTLEELGFNSTVIADAFIDCYDGGI